MQSHERVIELRGVTKDYHGLRPLRVEFDTRKFMLPIRLGTVNANGPQDLFIYTLTKKGRVETTNYRVKRLPSDVNIPEFVADEFPAFYRALFENLRPFVWPFVLGNTVLGVVGGILGYVVLREILERRRAGGVTAPRPAPTGQAPPAGGAC